MSYIPGLAIVLGIMAAVVVVFIAILLVSLKLWMRNDIIHMRETDFEDCTEDEIMKGGAR